MPRPLRVFLCHASQDKPAVRKLHRYLKQHGIEPWLDEIDLLPGEDWEVEIPNAIYSSDVILVCLSKNSINKEGYVQKEISFALDKALEKPEGTIFIIPAKLEDCEVPKRLNRYQWVDLFRPDSNKRLLLGLNKRALSLGSEVSPVIVDDTRQRKPASKPVVDFAPLDREMVDKASREKMEREEAAQAKLKQEAAEQAEIVRLAQETKEKAERDAAEKAALEKAEQEKQEREKFQLPVGRVGNPTNPLNEKASRAASPIYEDVPAPVVGRKPFTKVLDPSSLKPDPKIARKPASNNNLSWLGIGGTFLGVLLYVWMFGSNYIDNNSPVTETPIITFSATLKPATLTQTKILLTSTSAPSPTFTPTPGIGSTQVSKKDGMVLVYVPEGEFTMGSDNGNSDEKPVRKVNLNSFWIDQTEVTNAMYKLCVDDGDCELPSSTYKFDNLRYTEHPVVYVDWYKAKAYCEWRDARLPTEAEWEKAARGTDGRSYPWGEGISCSNANYYDGKHCIGDTSIVGSYEIGKSPYGLYDMTGNVWEWVNDWYVDVYYQNSPSSNPLGPASSISKVLRGGGALPFTNLRDGDWNYSGFILVIRSSFRNWSDPSNTTNIIGFRCSLSP